MDLREMSDQKLTQIHLFDPKISAKKDAFEKIRKSPKATLRPIPKKFKNWPDHGLNGKRQWCQIMLIL